MLQSRHDRSVVIASYINSDGEEKTNKRPMTQARNGKQARKDLNAMIQNRKYINLEENQATDGFEELFEPPSFKLKDQINSNIVVNKSSQITSFGVTRSILNPFSHQNEAGINRPVTTAWADHKQAMIVSSSFNKDSSSRNLGMQGRVLTVGAATDSTGLDTYSYPLSSAVTRSQAANNNQTYDDSQNIRHKLPDYAALLLQHNNLTSVQSPLMTQQSVVHFQEEGYE